MLTELVDARVEANNNNNDDSNTVGECTGELSRTRTVKRQEAWPPNL